MVQMGVPLSVFLQCSPVAAVGMIAGNRLWHFAQTKMSPWVCGMQILNVMTEIHCNPVGVVEVGHGEYPD